MLRTAKSQEELLALALSLREAAQGRILRLEALWRKRRDPLEKAREEFRRNLEHLKALEAEGHQPKALLAPAILREELRLKHLEEKLRRLDEDFRNRKGRLWNQARLKAARMAAKAGIPLDLEGLFPRVEDEPAR